MRRTKVVGMNDEQPRICREAKSLLNRLRWALCARQQGREQQAGKNNQDRSNTKHDYLRSGSRTNTTEVANSPASTTADRGFQKRRVRLSFFRRQIEVHQVSPEATRLPRA